mmetsp:Transcript_24560/g.56644  ORF Transcript_24560/g.56644 Transcript_24560/m.56644 type:complete len:350 (-) Transcript_24560:46-1095(-)
MAPADTEASWHSQARGGHGPQSNRGRRQADSVGGDLQRLFAAAAARKAQQPLQARRVELLEETRAVPTPGSQSSASVPVEAKFKHTLDEAVAIPVPDSSEESDLEADESSRAKAPPTGASQDLRAEGVELDRRRRRNEDVSGVGDLQRRLLAKARSAEAPRAKARSAAQQQEEEEARQRKEAAEAREQAEAATKAQAAALTARVAELTARVGPPKEAEAQPDGTFTLQLEDESEMKWSKRPDGTWRKPERRRAGWVGDLEQTRYTIPQARGVELASDRLVQFGCAVDGVRSITPEKRSADKRLYPEPRSKAQAAMLGPARHVVCSQTSDSNGRRIESIQAEIFAANGWQ